MSENHIWIKAPFKVQDRSMVFKIPKYKKFNGVISDSTPQTFKNLPSVVPDLPSNKNIAII